MTQVTLPQGSNLWTPSRRTLIGLLIFITAYVILGLVFQIQSGISPSNEKAPLEFFTRSLLWMLSLTCLLISNQHRSWKMVFWILGCVALAMLAIDERFEFHEQTGRRGWFDDDWFKIFSWMASGPVLFTIMKIQRPAKYVIGIIIAGYLIHATYIFVEMGDGEFFKLPWEKKSLRWVEEISELLFLSSYLVAFLIMLTTPPRRTES